MGAVIIGRNEAKRLPVCIASIQDKVGMTIYVDSGSTDGSVTLARDMGCTIVELDHADGFTAARARNAGFARLMEAQPTTGLVQFIDGDCELADGWLNVAVAAILTGCGKRLFP